MLFNRHRLLGINCIFRDLSVSLVSLQPAEAKEIAGQFCVPCIRQALKNRKKPPLCMYFQSLISEKPPAKSV